ncbi:hypothetical protein MPNT_250018 [Candidatus Methylacidithermus pantelleriae]|uniref:Uncharacterized protein n=1 Tax=Candidatus Methylacidithermus pantelleriae TaxID=2744239 RepID=A0A8J2BN73_9BACT|nr:hypothetical protein MPNT_250018 [Candidatus Methylacidithermus pantelleriae]
MRPSAFYAFVTLANSEDGFPSPLAAPWILGSRWSEMVCFVVTSNRILAVRIMAHSLLLMWWAQSM